MAPEDEGLPPLVVHIIYVKMSSEPLSCTFLFRAYTMNVIESEINVNN